ncbi:hypothetical protein DNI29_04365 [Hymenobacter sediminis]|uniref:hypothetical protein n=1 Tax=Hymenobacter sediminis TaxID=2218621 RepID=UPI000DA6581C|nr:hypothetical protein [Hymenobacter sediminis]RPD50037.1 hypothetical protein DNI29_04365 [Hymenobacter sediminis]
MNQATLAKAKELDQKIATTNEELASFQKPGIIIRVYTNESDFTLLTTIGTGGNCEHPDAEAAREFLAKLIARRQDDSAKLHEQFNAL